MNIFFLVICYSQSCENKDVGNGVFRWKCATPGEGREELCDSEAFCFEGRQDDSMLRMCVKRIDYISKFNLEEYEKMEEAEDPCTADRLPKLIPLFFPYGQECYCFTSLCNKKIELPNEFDVKGYKRAVETNVTIN